MLDKTAAPAEAPARPRPYSADPGAVQLPGLPALGDVIRRRKWPLIFCAVLLPAVAMLALSRTTPLYSATGTLIFEPGRFRAQELQSILQTDPTTEQIMASQAEVLRGLRLIEPMAQRLDLFSNPEFNASLRPPPMLARMRDYLPLLAKEAAAPEEPVGPSTRTSRNAVLLAAQRATTVRAMGTSHVLEVSFTASNPVLAAAAVNGLMDIYIKGQLAAKFSAVDKARNWLERRATELRTEVRSQEDRIAVYRAEHGLVQGVHAETDVEAITQLTENLAKARAELAAAEGKLNAARHHTGNGGEAEIAPSVVHLREQSSDLDAQLTAMTTQLGPSHPRVIELRRQIALVKSQEGAEMARVVSATEAELRAARERVAALEQDVAAAQARVERSAAAQIPLNAMQRDADASRALLASVLQRLQETAERAAVETPDAHEVSLALPPSSPSYPRTFPILAGAAAAGVLLGCFLIYLLELMDTTLASGDDVRMALGIKCFGLVPEVGRRRRGRIRIEDYGALRPLGGFAEQIRALRAGLWVGATRPRTVAVTASRPGDGKTTIAMNLARTAALCGEKVLLLDCDVRMRGVAQLFGVETEPGLTELLTGEAELQAVIRRDPLTPMSYIPAGAVGIAAAGLFMSEAMMRLLQKLRDSYDLVLLDAPPAVAIADTRLIAQVAEATLFCARWRRTKREVARNAIEWLEEAQASVVGVVMTRVDARVHERSGYADAQACGPRLSGYFQD